MNNRPKISIIVPIYNVEKYLVKCLDSLVNQTLKEIEIILVDDGSPDNCPKICDEYANKDNRIKVIHKQNAGVSAARNTGIEIATAEWLAFVDADDWVEEDMFEEAYKRTVNCDVDMVLFNFYSNYEKKEVVNKKIPQEDFITDNQDIIQQLKLSVLHETFGPYNTSFTLMGAPWNKIFKASIVKENKIEFPLEVKGVFDDALFNLYYYDYVKKVVFFNKPLYHYRRLSTSILNKFKPNKLEINQAIFNKIEEYIKQHNDDELLKNAYNSRVVLYLHITINLYFFNKDNTKSVREKIAELKETIETEPYKEALKKVNPKYLTKLQRIYYKCLKRKKLFTLYVLFNLKKIVEFILKRNQYK